MAQDEGRPRFARVERGSEAAGSGGVGLQRRGVLVDVVHEERY